MLIFVKVVDSGLEEILHLQFGSKIRHKTCTDWDNWRNNISG